MQKNSNSGCVYLLLFTVVMSLVLWWLNEHEQKEKQVLNERWEELRIRMVRAKERAAKPAIRSDLDSAAVKEVERRIWAVSAQPPSRGGNDPDYFQDRYDDYRNDPEDELRFPPEVFDASDD